MIDAPFEEFPKIPRLSRGCTITEKIDGTNAQVFVTEDGRVLAGSRNRWITPEQDNYGFAKWVVENQAALLKLGPGRHFGEWWGAGIQRRYGLSVKRFSLFNTSRWANNAELPLCCFVVPVIHHGEFTDGAVTRALEELRRDGSVAAPGFTRPEGIVVYHHASRTMFKKTIERDAKPKSEAGAVAHG